MFHVKGEIMSETSNKIWNKSQLISLKSFEVKA